MQVTNKILQAERLKNMNYMPLWQFLLKKKIILTIWMN